MNRFFKLTASFALIAGFSLLANDGFAKGHAKVKAAGTHKHRINLYGPGNGAGNTSVVNPIFGPPSGSGSGPVGPPIQPPPHPKPHPIAVLPSGPDKPLF